MTSTAPTATPVGRARGPARPGYLVLGLALVAAAIAGELILGTGVWSVLVWAVAPDLALLLAIGARTAPGQLPRRAVPAYNLLHAPLLPLLLLVVAGAGLLSTYWLVAAVTWLAHICIDRGCGYGPRTPEGWQRG